MEDVIDSALVNEKGDREAEDPSSSPPTFFPFLFHFIVRARCVATLLHKMKRRGGVISICIGMGAAAVFERGNCTNELRNARKVELNNLLSKYAR